MIDIFKQSFGDFSFDALDWCVLILWFFLPFVALNFLNRFFCFDRLDRQAPDRFDDLAFKTSEPSGPSSSPDGLDEAEASLDEAEAALDYDLDAEHA